MPVMLGLIVFISALTSGLCTPPISSKAELNARIDAGPNRKVGFLSMGNYNSMAPLLSDLTEPTIYDDTDHLNQAVLDGTVLAGFMSGIPNATVFHAFSSELVSPRSFQMSLYNSTDLIRAVDAAIVRTHHNGDILRAMQANPPFEAVEVHNCRSDDVSLVPFPAAESATGLLADILSTRTLKLLALGASDNKPNWHADGNWQVDPPVGFWPHYMDSFMREFRAAYGQDITLERVWETPSSNTARVQSGEVHMTEPYYIAENMYDGTNEIKKWAHTFGCFVMGYEQRFFVPKETVTVNDQANAQCATELQTCVNRRMSEQINSKHELNARVDAATTDADKSVAFLSMGNYNYMSPLLSDNVIPAIFTSTDEIYDALRAGTVVAGMISGIPESEFHRFPTELISPRAFQMKSGTDATDLIQAVDAAVVRTHNAGDILRAMQASPPFEAVEVHNCRVDDPSLVPFPAAENATGLLADVLQQRKLKILAVGDASNLPDWQQDGNYQANPPTGFWPHYMNSFMTQFRAAYGNDIELERVWHSPSSDTSLVMSGEVHMTEPYYIYENLYDGTGEMKKWSHSFSCIVMGYEQQFFGRKAVTDFTSAGSSCDQQLAACNFVEVSHGGIQWSLASSVGWLMGLVLLMRG